MNSSHRIRTLLVTAAIATAALIGTTAAPATAAPATLSLPTLVLYVAPTAKGIQLGTKAHPFANLQLAQAAVRLINHKMLTDIEVRLSAGSYQLAKPLTFTSKDSGTNGHRIAWRAAQGASVVLSGGTAVKNWTVSDSAKGIWKANVGDLATRQLYVDDTHATRARRVENPAGFSKVSDGYAITDATIQSWRNPKDIEIVSSWGWKLQRCLADSVSATRMVMQQPCWHNANLQQGQEIQNPSWIENAYELLDQPGEWYLDKIQRALYYKPVDGKNPNASAIVAPRLTSLVNLDGTIDKPVQNLSLDGLTFSHSTWLEPSSPEGLIEGQAGFRMIGTDNADFNATRPNWKKTPGAVNAGYTNGIRFEDNIFTHLGAVGLNLNTGSQNTTIVGNTFRDVSATGIQIGGQLTIDHHPADQRSVTKNTVVRNNLVTDVAVDYRGSVGILAGYTDSTTIEHNRVYDLPYSGISVGWGWGLTDKGGNTNYDDNGGYPRYDTDTTSRKTIVRDNWVSDIMQHQADGGAIYTLSNSPDSVVSGNLITDVPYAAYGAIYHDEGTRNWSTFGNAFCNIEFQWLLANHGIDLDIRHNVTTNARYSTQGGTINTLVTSNSTVDGCAQLPASVVRNAGLESAYRHLDPQAPPTDGTAPSTPTAVTGSAPFPTSADITWTAAHDDTAVTGYSVFLDGNLVAATGSTGVRLDGLERGTTYQVTVTARDLAANESAASASFALTTPNDENVALGKDVLVSSFSDPNTAALAVDGDLTTRWAQGLGLPDPSSIQVDLGAVHEIHGLITTFELSRGYRYRLETSTDEVTWTTLEDHTGAATTASANYTPLSTAVAGRYVRLTITGSSGNGGSIYELEVYGTPAVPNGDTTPPVAPSAPDARAVSPFAIDVSWTAPTGDPATYELWDGDKRVAVTAQTSQRITGLLPGSAHAYTVVARDAALNRSQPSAATAVRTPADANLALGATVEASSQYSNDYGPALVVDGNMGTRWAQASGRPDPSWVRIDLGTTHQISAVAASFEHPSGYAYLLESSVDGQTWTIFDDHTATKTTERTNYSSADSPVAARYLRLTVTNSSGNGGSIWEIQVYGE